MNPLDDLATIQSIDRFSMGEQILSFPDQCAEAVEIGNKLLLPSLSKVNNILLAGMGGSAIVGDLLQSYLRPELTIPMIVNRDYSLPRFVNKNTLVIISSYSGDTEETLAAYLLAKKRNAQMVIITSGGELLRQSEIDGVYSICIPSGYPPRVALGYLFFPLLILLMRIHLIKTAHAHSIDETEAHLKTLAKQYSPVQLQNGNLAKGLANYLFGKLAVVYAAEEQLGAIVTRWRTQINENSKSLILTNVLPEMNHNEIMGWNDFASAEAATDFPSSSFRVAQTAVVFLRDKDEHPQNQRRMSLSKQITSSITKKVMEVWSSGNSLLTRLFSLLYLGDWVSYYLAILNRVDPTPVTTIDWLKNKLTERTSD